MARDLCKTIEWRREVLVGLKVPKVEASRAAFERSPTGGFLVDVRLVEAYIVKGATPAMALELATPV
jgi:hypothetical protein